MTSIVLRLAIIALLVYAGVTFWYGRVEERLQMQKPPEQREDTVTSVGDEGHAAPAADNYQSILTRNIFKAVLESGNQTGDQSQIAVEDLSETKLHLVLLGTVTGGKDDSRAIIRDGNTKLEDLYQVGSEVQGALISRISRGKVVLLANGREEILTIKDPDNDDQGQGAVSRMESRMPGRGPGATGREIENKVPEALPRRRISFRDASTPAPPPSAVENPTTPRGEEGPVESVDGAPVPEGAAALPDTQKVNGAEQQGQ